MAKQVLKLFILPLLMVSCVSNKAYLRGGGNEFTLEVSTTPCFGSCPVYDLTIKESGLAVYNGKHFPETGEVFKPLPMWEVDSLRKVLVRNDFFELDSVYDNPQVTDLPSVKIYIQLGNGTEKTVLSRYDQPQNLKNITAFIERLRRRNFQTE